MSTNFKLTKDVITRRVAFPGRPPWSVLADRINQLFEIPVANVGVSYVDSDGDVVTLSTDEELQEYYLSSIASPNQLVKFIVVDLGSLRGTPVPSEAPHSRPSSSAATEVPGPNQRPRDRDSFGGLGGDFFDIGTEWRYPDINAFPGMVPPPPPMPQPPRSNSPLSHGFIESVHSDASIMSKGMESEDDSDNESDIVDLSGFNLDKGKGKASHSLDDDVSSTSSVLCENEPEKFPVHVFDVYTSPHVSLAGSVKAESTARASDSPQSTVVPMPTHSTPKPTIHTVSDDVPVSERASTVAEEIPAVSEQTQESIPDPPVPDIEPKDQAADSEVPPPVFSNDVASFLNSLGTTLGSHPELMEGLRNILTNTRTGAYWSAHREAMSRAAEGIARQAEAVSEEMRRDAEAEASRRVTEALGNLFRSFSTLATVDPAAVGPAVPPAAAPTGEENGSSAPGEDDFWSPRNSFWGTFGPGHGHRGHRNSSWGFPFGGLSTWSPEAFDYGSFHQRSSSPPPGGPRGHAHRHFPPGPPRFRGFRQSFPAPPPDALHPRGPPPPGPPPPPPPPPAPQPPPPPAPPSPPRSDPMPPLSQKPTQQELRERVEIAKQMYQLEKARYRKDREERKRDRRIQYQAEASGEKRKAAPHVTIQSPPLPASPRVPPPVKATEERTVAHFVPTKVGGSVSQSEGTNKPKSPPPRFPVMKPASVQPIPGPSGSQDKGGLNGRQRSVHRITKKLADMGFTETAFTTLPNKIEEQVGVSTPTSQDQEDNVVTNVLEELLSMPPKSPTASRSGYSKRGDDTSSIPGSWH